MPSPDSRPGPLLSCWLAWSPSQRPGGPAPNGTPESSDSGSRGTTSRCASCLSRLSTLSVEPTDRGGPSEDPLCRLRLAAPGQAAEFLPHFFVRNDLVIPINRL